MTGSSNRLTGGCQCGALRYEWLEKPTHSSVCYCRMCQKASGQPFRGLTGGERENLRWTRGTLSIFKSSNMVERGFCRDCGTPLTFLGGSFYSVNMLPSGWRTITLLNPVVYLISGFRWSFYEISDVSIWLSVAVTLGFLAGCMIMIWWIFKTGYRLKN